MVFDAGQYEAGGLGLASGHVEAEAASKLRVAAARGRTSDSARRRGALTESSVTGKVRPFGHRAVRPGGPRRSLISLEVIVAQAEAPSVKPNWNAEIRSTPNRARRRSCSSRSLSSGSREGNMAARRLFSPSPVLRGEARDLPSATQRMYTPARAVGLLFGHQVGTPRGFNVACFCGRGPYLVGQHHGDGHIAIGFSQRRHQHRAVPADGVVLLAEAGVDESSVSSSQNSPS